MIIFLDFDGVLHPSPSGYQGIFCHLERFETVMRERPYIRIVISSSWRETYPWDVCTGIFSTDVQGRIIGMTPTIPSGVRYEEINAWLVENNYTGPWLALDDAKQEFPERYQHLVLCEMAIGFDEEAAARLRTALAKSL